MIRCAHKWCAGAHAHLKYFMRSKWVYLTLLCAPILSACTGMVTVATATDGSSKVSGYIVSLNRRGGRRVLDTIHYIFVILLWTQCLKLCITKNKVRNLIKLEVRTTLHPSFLLAPVEGWGSFGPVVFLEHQVTFPGAPLSSRPKKLCAPLHIFHI